MFNPKLIRLVVPTQIHPFFLKWGTFLDPNLTHFRPRSARHHPQTRHRLYTDPTKKRRAGGDEMQLGSERQQQLEAGWDGGGRLSAIMAKQAITNVMVTMANFDTPNLDVCFLLIILFLLIRL